ncbi:MAG: fatty-acid peroxygenase [Isosphaeraceae bacterium]|jgi:fatty-acid peroxygenase|nr:MAG: fatty-acid peroxygenase [Isosphaeraceae bacterium]
MPQIPRDKWPDSTLALMSDPYRFISKRCRRYQSDLFEARLMLRKTICMTGRDGAALFYDEDRFTRSGVAPAWLQKTLFGQGGVQGLDREAHRHRKQMFMSLMAPERIERLGAIAGDWWQVYARKWAGADRVVLYGEVNEILSRAVCAWAGVPLAEPEVGRRTTELMAMFDRAATLSPAHLWSRLARRRAERWIGDLIEDIRAGRLKPPEESAAWVVAMHRDLKGGLLDRHTAAVELINVLRPTVAVSVFITFAALALHQYPACRERLAAGEAGYADLFAQEVRRFYPFFPAVMARVRHDFEWKGYHFPKGRRVVLDLYGTNHDPRTWEEPEAFRPERFRRWDGCPFDFIPQGGGDHHRNHRCPGEWIAVELIKVSSGFLAGGITYDMPEQDLRIDYGRLPALPRSRFIINNVRLPTTRK